MVDVDLSSVIQLAMVLLLLVALGPLIFKPFLATLDERDRRTSERKAEAGTLTKRAEALFAEYESRRLAAVTRAGEAKMVLRVEGGEVRAGVVDAARAAASARRVEVVGRLADEVKAARAAIEPQIQQISRLVAKKLLGRGV